MKKFLLAPLAVAMMAPSCQASEVTPTQQGCVAEYHKYSNGFTYVARLYDESPKSITLTKISAYDQSAKDIGSATFNLYYNPTTNRQYSVYPGFQEMNFKAENQEELLFIEALAKEIVEKHKCYFRPPVLQLLPANVYVSIGW